MGYFSAVIGAGSDGFVFAPFFTAAGIVLGCWVLYTIVWRAVRRGLREHYEETRPLAAPDYSELHRRR